MASENEDPVSITSTKHYFQFNYAKHKDLAIGEKLSSSVFHAFGHDWVIDCFPQGKSTDITAGAFVSIFLRLVGQSRNVSVRFELRILHRDGIIRGDGAPHLDKLHRFDHGMFAKPNASQGRIYFIKRVHLISEFVKDGVFQICCTFFPTNKIQKKSSAIEYPWPQSNIFRELCEVLSSGDMADVTIEVGGKTFRAHKFVLALRSPVFKAELYGNMAEAISGHIKINDMEACVFEAMLSYIYTDSFNYESTKDEETLIMVKDLLAAADRYALDELKLSCEEMLYQNINLDSVVTNLSLAELHNCPRLKDVCLSFIAEPSMYTRVTLTEAYIDVIHTFPSLLKELRDKVNGHIHSDLTIPK